MQLRRLPTRFRGASRLPSFKRWRSFTAPPVVIPPEAWDVLPAPLFHEGLGESYNIANTGPIDLGYVAGGTYDVDASGTQLPAGMTLSAAGMLADGGTAPANLTGIVFGYNEPGALPILTLNSGTPSGTLPYMATVYPLEGTVPAGMNLVSPEDATLRGSILSVWDDGSAKVMVVAGHKTGILANSTSALTLRPAVVTDIALTVAAVTSKFTTGISVNFGGGVQTLNTWTSPDRIWWANSQVICARYRLACGLGAMEAVIDVHAFAQGRAFVEVQVENGSINSAVNPTVTWNASQPYTGATISVNGVAITPVGGVSASYPVYDDNDALIGTYTFHDSNRAWYCSGWIGGDPGIEVTHDPFHLQKHPGLFKMARPSSLNLQTIYQSDAYTPWTTGRQRKGNMGAGGDAADTIGVLCRWDWQYVQSGSKYAQRATIANTLAILVFNLNVRDSTTHRTPTYAQVGHKYWADGSPTGAHGWTLNQGNPEWEIAHHPAVGFAAFLCRPSPVFIELAQRVALHNAGYESDKTGFPGGPMSFFGYGQWYQTRGKAWCLRSLAHALFLTPDYIVTTSGSTPDDWRSSAQDSLHNTLTNSLNPYMDSAINPLNVVYSYKFNQPWDTEAGPGDLVGQQSQLWFSHYLCQVMAVVANLKVAKSADRAGVDTFTDWLLQMPIRYVNESYGGEWRYHRYQQTIGRTSGVDQTQSGDAGFVIDSLPTWGEMFDWIMTDGPPAEAGPWMLDPNSNHRTTYAAVTEVHTSPHNGSGNWCSHFWGAFAAAVDRGVPGADAAWARVVGNGVTTGCTNLQTWLDGFGTGTSPTDGYYPRNK